MQLQTARPKVLLGRSFAILCQSGVNYGSSCAGTSVFFFFFFLYLCAGTVPLVSRVSGVRVFYAGKAKVDS